MCDKKTSLAHVICNALTTFAQVGKPTKDAYRSTDNLCELHNYEHRDVPIHTREQTLASSIRLDLEYAFTVASRVSGDLCSTFETHIT